MTSKHARNSASSSKRWMTCPGSIKLSEKCPKPKSSSFAAEGTAAHELGEMLLREYYFNIDAGPITELNGFGVTTEMAEAVHVYVDYLVGKVSHEQVKNKEMIVKIEEKFSLEWLHPGMFGTNDCMVYDPEKKHLTIVDYKHGMGIVVEPNWNSQLMFYALGAAYVVWKETKKPGYVTDLIQTIELVVAQPRAYHIDGPIRSWTLSSKDLFFWGLNVLRPSALETEMDDAALRAGDHCRFCPALAVCPENAKKALAIAKTDFDNPILPSPESLTASDIEKVMEASSIFKVWSEEVKAFAQQKMEQGLEIPGFKLVQRKSNRKWASEEVALDALETHLGEDAYAKKVLTVAQAEKALKVNGISPEVALDGLWFKPNAGVTMVPESDRRRAVVPSVIEDFIDDQDFLQ